MKRKDSVGKKAQWGTNGRQPGEDESVKADSSTVEAKTRKIRR